MNEISGQSENLQETYLKKLKANTKKDCRILYSDGRPGWECGLGWTKSLSKLSYAIECENQLFYDKFGVYAAADQIKEKFGTLRFYYTVHRDIPAIPRFIRDALKRGYETFSRNVNFRMTFVTIEPARTVITFKEIQQDEQAHLKTPHAWPNREILVSADGKFRCLYEERRKFEIQQRIPTRHKALWHAMRLLNRLQTAISNVYTISRRRQNIAAEYLDDEINELVRKAENECFSVCENCGMEIGTDYSPRCETKGWITYVCEACARKRGQYIKGKALYSAEGEKISDIKKDIEAEDENT